MGGRKKSSNRFRGCCYSMVERDEICLHRHRGAIVGKIEGCKHGFSRMLREDSVADIRGMGGRFFGKALLNARKGGTRKKKDTYHENGKRENDEILQAENRSPETACSLFLRGAGQRIAMRHAILAGRGRTRLLSFFSFADACLYR